MQVKLTSGVNFVVNNKGRRVEFNATFTRSKHRELILRRSFHLQPENSESEANSCRCWVFQLSTRHEIRVLVVVWSKPSLRFVEQQTSLWVPECAQILTETTRCMRARLHSHFRWTQIILPVTSEINAKHFSIPNTFHDKRPKVNCG